jgi:GNAT superfamily N-acetyltransferase
VTAFVVREQMLKHPGHPDQKVHGRRGAGPTRADERRTYGDLTVESADVVGNARRRAALLAEFPKDRAYGSEDDIIHNEIANHYGHYSVVRDKTGRIIGEAGYIVTPGSGGYSGDVLLHEIRVRSDARGSGAGRALMADAAAAPERLGLKGEFTMGVYNPLQPAWGFYAAMGGKPFSEDSPDAAPSHWAHADRLALAGSFQKRTYVRDRQGQFAATASSRVAAGHETTIEPGELRDTLDHFAGMKGDPNLTLLDVKGTHLFNVGGDHARHDMPQVPSHRKAEFVRDMKADGRTVLRVDLDPLTLKPSQGEISARAVGQIAKRERNGNPALTDDAARIIVSSDGYVLDGHHRWGAFAALAIDGDKRTIPAFQMAAKRDDALALLRDWGKRAGVQSLALGERAQKALDEHAMLKHLPGQHDQSTHGHGKGATGGHLTTTPTGEDLPEGWGRLDGDALLQRRIQILIDEDVHPDDAEWVAKRQVAKGNQPTVYENGAVTIEIHPDADKVMDPGSHAAIVRQADFLNKAAPVQNLTIRIDDWYVTKASGSTKGDDVVGWTTMKHADKDGHATIAIRPVAFTNRTPLREGLTVGSGGQYVMAHEWGHAVKQPKGYARALDGSHREAALYRLFGDAAQVSAYAMSQPAEFYAEAFADWHQSRGQTKRPVVRKAAQEFGWFGSDA